MLLLDAMGVGGTLTLFFHRKKSPVTISRNRVDEEWLGYLANLELDDVCSPLSSNRWLIYIMNTSCLVPLCFFDEVF
jgi:hypothetical protein